ncbi:MAG: glycosyltransferase [Patescibacteria group bacterium]
MKKDLEFIFFNMSAYRDWRAGVVNRNYHIFFGIQNYPQVKKIIGVDFLPFNLFSALRVYLKDILPRYFKKNIYQDLTTTCFKPEKDKNLYIISTIDSYIQPKTFIKKIDHIISRLNGSLKDAQRIIVSYHPLFVDLAPLSDGAIKIFETVDNWTEHPSYRNYKNKLNENYKFVAQNYDMIFTVAESLVSFFANLGREKRCYWLANGVDINHFLQTVENFKNRNVLKDIEDIKKPIIGYIGTIQNRVDVKLLEYIAENNPDKSLVLIGPVWPQFLRRFRRPAVELRNLQKMKNVYFLGRKSYQLSPYYIKHFAVGIIPHRLDEFIKYTYSLKMLEYLACGIPTVTSSASGVNQFSHLIHIATDYRDFNDKINKAIDQDTLELRELRIKAVKDFSWQGKIREFIDKTNDFIEQYESYQN